MTPEAIYSGLVGRGLSPVAAEGVLMNLRSESGLDPGINELAPVVPGSRGGFGLAQWTGPRRVALEEFASARGVPVSDPDLQLDFLMMELGSTERRAGNALASASTPQEAATVFLDGFLRPAKEHADRRRAEYTGGTYSAGMSGYGNPMLPPEAQQVAAMNALAPPERPQMPQINMLDPAAFMSKRRFG